jgi:hypothetical protein
MEPKNFFDELVKSYLFNERRYYYYKIENKFDTQNLDAEKWLNTISVEGYKLTKGWSGDLCGSRRAIKKLTKIAKNVRIESGYLLASVFLNVMVVRDKTTTEIIDGKEMEDFSSNPYDFDYDISPDPDTLAKTIKNAQNGRAPKKVICAVVTQDSNQPPACPTCKGKGFLQCKKCGGTGRGGKYIEDTYATGIARKKTGQCPNCFGKGKVECVKCSGSGKQQMFSNQYQIVKKFEDKKEARQFACISTSWKEVERCYKYRVSYERDRYHGIGEGYYDTLVYFEFENSELENGLDKLYKNQKEIIIDNKLSLPNAISKDCNELYESNKEEALEFFEKYAGKLGCSVEKHLAIPMFRLYYSIDGRNQEYSIDIYKFFDKGTCCFDDSSFPVLSFFKSLFLK